jgi:O-antigen/teichoic acid export membrane protein
MKKKTELEKPVEKQNLSKIALKGSAYNLTSLLILKFGGLIFTIIIARILLPELFGIYTLALSIVTLILFFTDLGINKTFLRYASDSIGRKNEKLSRGYFKYFSKIKFLLIILVVVLFLVFSKYISYNIYEKPILFYPLIFSSLYIIAESFKNFLSLFFPAQKDMKTPVFLDTSIQLSKILFSVLAILILTDSLKVTGIFLAFFVSSAFTLGITFFILLKRNKNLMFGKSSKPDKSRVNKYWKYVALSSLSLSFFGVIDNLMMGKFIASEYIAYYAVSLSLALTVASLFSLSNILLPIFTQIHTRRFSRGFHKAMKYILVLSIPASVGLAFIGKHLVYLIYGTEYLPAMSSFYFLIPLVITAPLIALYSILFESKEKPQIVSKAVLISLFINILFNILAIYFFLNKPLLIIAGIAASTTLSRITFLTILVINSKKQFNFSIRGLGLKRPVLATLIMALFLLLFNNYVDINLIHGAIEIILGAGIYFGVMILIKGVKKEDWKLVRG